MWKPTLMVYWTLSSFCYLPLPVYISSRDDEILFKFSGLRDTTTTTDDDDNGGQEELIITTTTTTTTSLAKLKMWNS